MILHGRRDFCETKRVATCYSLVAGESAGAGAGGGVRVDKRVVLQAPCFVICSLPSPNHYSVHPHRCTIHPYHSPDSLSAGESAGAGAGEGVRVRGREALYTLHSTPCPLRLTPYTPHPTPHTLHPTLYTLRPTPYTPHHAPYTP